MNNKPSALHFMMIRLAFMLLLLFGVYAGFMPSGLIAAEIFVIDDPAFISQPMGKYLEYYVDSTNQLTIEEIVVQDGFQDTGPGYPAFGYSRASYWIRFTVNNLFYYRVKWYLEFNYAPIDIVELFIPEERDYKKMMGGDQYEFGIRPIKSRNVVFPMDQSPGETTYYLRVQSSGSVNIALHAWTPEAFEDKERLETLLFWTYYGIMLAMIMYGIMLGILTREISNFYLSMFIISATLFSMVQNGIAFQYLWPNSMKWANISNPFSLILCAAWAVRFTICFLDTALHARRLHYIAVFLFWLGLIFLAAPFVVDYYYSTQLSISYGLAAIIINCACGFYLMLKRYRQANFYMAAWFVFLFCSAITVLRSFGIMQINFISVWGMQIGTALTIILLSLGIADKINTISAEKEKALIALGESEKKYRSLVENAHDGILLIVAEKVIYANRAMQEMLEIPVEEFDQIHILELLPDKPYGLKYVYDIYKKRIAGLDAPSRYEAQLMTKRGAIIDVLISSALLTLDENQAVISIITNITERKQAENALRKAHAELEHRVLERTAELRKANVELKVAKKSADDSAKAKSEFLANMSHEIRTPMNGILGVCDLFTNTKMDRLQREYLDIIRSSSRSLLNLINDILDFSKIEAGRLDFEQIPFFLRELMEEVADMFMNIVQKKDLELVVDISSDVPAKMIADPLRLRQVLVNLTSNALKFTERGEIKLSVRNRTSDENHLELLFCVKDSGIGMDQTALDNLFTPFTQADGSISRKYGGTGLGLAISKKIVKAMGGDIWAESTPGLGSSFYFTGRFTLLDVNENSYPAKPDILKDLSVLIVEDNSTVQVVLQRCLESFGCIPTSVSSAEEALELYEQRIADHPFDLIVMDYKLYEMDGISAAEIIKKDQRIKPPPIIMISGYLRDNDFQRAKDVGIESCLIKPVKQSALLENILELFGSPAPIKKTKESGLIKALEFNNIKLLLVEDHPTNRRVVKEILTTAGFLVDSVGSGLEAVEAVKKTSYQAVLMDIQMPEMDGLQATRIIREDLLIWDIPIIAMTAHVMPGDRERCLDSGMNDYVSKPIDRIQLFNTLRKYISTQNQQPDVSAKNNLPDIFSDFEIKGLHVNKAMKRLGLSLNAYIEIFVDFAAMQKSFINEFKELLKHGNLNQALNKIHSLKGAAATVAAELLTNKAQIIEHDFPWADQLKLQQQLQELDTELQLVITIAETIKIHNPAPIADSSDTKDKLTETDASSDKILCALVDKLKKSLEDYDPILSKEYYDLIGEKISGGHNNKEFQRLGKYIEQYHFDSALKSLEKLITEQKIDRKR